MAWAAEDRAAGLAWLTSRPCRLALMSQSTTAEGQLHVAAHSVTVSSVSSNAPYLAPVLLLDCGDGGPTIIGGLVSPRVAMLTVSVA